MSDKCTHCGNCKDGCVSICKCCGKCQACGRLAAAPAHGPTVNPPTILPVAPWPYPFAPLPEQPSLPEQPWWGGYPSWTSDRILLVGTDTLLARNGVQS